LNLRSIGADGKMEVSLFVIRLAINSIILPHEFGKRNSRIGRAESLVDTGSSGEAGFG
jgi:hypothetical protein